MIADKIGTYQTFKARSSDIEFKSIEDNGPLTICLQVRSERATRLVIVNFQSCSRYSVMMQKEPLSTTKAEAEQWLFSFGPEHMIVTRDRLIEVTSTCAPSLRVLGISG